MTTLRTITTTERNNSLRVLTSRYGVLTARQLIEAYGSKDKYTYLGYTVERLGSRITVKNQSGESTTIEIGDKKLTPEQQETALNKIWEGIKQFFQEHAEDIKSGNIKAVDVGGAIYGIAATVIVFIFTPLAALGPLGKLISIPFVELASQKGRYWGSAVDELVKLIKGESDLNKAQIVGVLTTVFVVATYLPGLEVGGVDAWNLTVQVGEKLGGAVADIIDEIEKVPVVGDVVKAGEDLGEDVLDFFGLG